MIDLPLQDFDENQLSFDHKILRVPMLTKLIENAVNICTAWFERVVD